MRKFVAALFAVLAIAVIAAGCGGGGDSTGSSSVADTGSSTAEDGSGSSETGSGGVAPTKAAFIKEADKICVDSEEAMVKELTDYAEENGIATEKEPDDDQKVELTEKVVLPNLSKQAEELEGLTPPEGDEATIEDLTGTLSGAVAEAEDDPSIVLDGKLLDAASKKAEAYGLESCA
jgi:hypothetical protein